MFEDKFVPKTCYYCGEFCDELSGNPSKWPIPLCHADAPGVPKYHHIGCVQEHLSESAGVYKEALDDIHMTWCEWSGGHLTNDEYIKYINEALEKYILYSLTSK